MDSTDFHTEVMPCPYCGAPHDTATSYVKDAEAPASGTLFICLVCACPAFVTDDGLRRLALDEMKIVIANPQVIALIAACIAASRSLGVSDDPTPLLKYMPRSGDAE